MYLNFQAEEAAKKGQKATYGRFYQIKHRHADGSPTSREAEEQIVKFLFIYLFLYYYIFNNNDIKIKLLICLCVQARIEAAEREIAESQGDNVDPTASLRAALGPQEHPGRVRGMGFGARPTVVYGRSGDPGSAQSTASSQPSTSGPIRGGAEFEAQMRERLTHEITERVTDQVYDRLDSWVHDANSTLERIQRMFDPDRSPLRVPLPPRPPKQPRNRSPEHQDDDQPPAA